MNNERSEKNEGYKKQMVRLERYVLVEAVKDTIITPHASESHGFYKWGDEKTVVPLRETEGYREDHIGLKTLDHDGKLHAVNMKPGDLLLYESAKLLHGRPTPFDGDFYANIFVHYMPESGWKPET